MKKTPERLRFVIKQLGMTQAEFADSIGTTPATLSRQLNGVHSIDKQSALAVQAVHGIDHIWLLTGEGEMFLSDSPGSAQAPPQKQANGLTAIEGNAEIFDGEINHVRWFFELTNEQQTAILAIAEVKNKELVHRIKETLLFEVEAQRREEEQAAENPSLRKKGEAG